MGAVDTPHTRVRKARRNHLAIDEAVARVAHVVERDDDTDFVRLDRDIRRLDAVGGKITQSDEVGVLHIDLDERRRTVTLHQARQGNASHSRGCYWHVVQVEDAPR